MMRRVFSRGPWRHQSMCKEQRSLKMISAVEKSVANKSTSLPYPKNPTGMAKSTSATSRVEPNKFRHLEEAGDARFVKRILLARLRKPRNQARVAKDRLQSRCLQTSRHQRVIAWSQTLGRTHWRRKSRLDSAAYPYQLVKRNLHVFISE
jgi:hypothetical protein